MSEVDDPEIAEGRIPDDGSAIEDEDSEPGFIIICRDRSKDPDPRLVGNPMAMAMPPPCPDEDIVNVFSRDPDTRPPDFKQKILPERFEYLSRLALFHHLFQSHIDFIHKVIAVVRASFISRDPRLSIVLAFIWQIIDGRPGHLNRLSGLGGGGGLGLLVIGPSGVGKTSLIDRIVDYFRPKARIHLRLAGRRARWMQLGVVKVTVRKTWKLTLLEILQEADRQVQMDYYVRRARDPSIGMLQQYVWEALTSHFCPLLILDEFQTLGRLRPEDAIEILEGLILLMEKAGIPVMLVGTEAVRSLLLRYRNQLEKFSNEGMTECGPLLPDDPSLDEIVEDAAILIETFKGLHVSVREPVYSPDFDKQLIAHTMGVPRVMREYFKVIFRRHSIEEAEGRELLIGDILLKEISKAEMRIYEPAMDVLRKRRLGIAISAEDWKTYEHYLPPEPERTKAQRSLAFEWITKNNDIQRPLPASEYTVLQKGLSARPVEAAGTPSPAKADGAANEASGQVPAPQVAAPAPQAAAARPVPPPVPPSRPSTSRKPADLVKELRKKREKRLVAKEPQKEGGPPTVTAGDLE